MIHVADFGVKAVSIRNLVIAAAVLQRTECRFTEYARWRNVARVKDLYIVENVRRFLVNFWVNIPVTRSMETIRRERESSNAGNGQRAKGDREYVANCPARKHLSEGRG